MHRFVYRRILMWTRNIHKHKHSHKSIFHNTTHYTGWMIQLKLIGAKGWIHKNLLIDKKKKEKEKKEGFHFRSSIFFLIFFVTMSILQISVRFSNFILGKNKYNWKYKQNFQKMKRTHFFQDRLFFVTNKHIWLLV